MDPEEIGQDTGQQQEVTEQEPEGSGLNPAWNDLLGVVPSQLHSQVTPHLEKWDRNYQESIGKVHSQYEPYKPYLDNQIAPEQINYALQLVQAIESRPAEVIQALQQFAGLEDTTQGQGQQNQTGQQGQVDDETEVPDFVNHPEFQKINEMVNAMAQILVQQNMSQQQSQEDQQLAEELDQLHETHGDFDEEWVLTRALNNPEASLEDHVKAYHQFETSIVEKVRKPGPRVMGAGGAAPDNQVDVNKLDGAGRRSLIAQMLQASAQQDG